MFPFGFFGLALGMFLVDCAVTNRSPVQVLEAIIADPKNLRDILSRTKGTGYQSSYVPTSGTSGAAALPGLLNPNGVLGGSASGQAIVAWARGQIGKPYKWGAAGPNAFDCSGLTMQAYYHGAGIKLPHFTGAQITMGHRVSKADLEPGDLVFPDIGHVQIYSGNGNIIEAPHTGLNVREVKMWGFMTARRIVRDKPTHAHKTPASHIKQPGFADIFGGNTK